MLTWAPFDAEFKTNSCGYVGPGLCHGDNVVPVSFVTLFNRTSECPHPSLPFSVKPFIFSPPPSVKFTKIRVVFGALLAGVASGCVLSRRARAGAGPSCGAALAQARASDMLASRGGAELHVRTLPPTCTGDSAAYYPEPGQRLDGLPGRF